MYFTIDTVMSAINQLSNVHPFHGITFLSCKLNNLPVGNQIEYKMDYHTRAFLNENHKIHVSSSYFYQPFTVKDEKWLEGKYPSAGLQSVNTRTFKDAFMHDTKIPKDGWAWQENYVSTLQKLLNKNKKIPMLALAIWIFKYKDWPEQTDAEDILNTFIQHFKITDSELVIFDDIIDLQPEILSLTPVNWDLFSYHIQAPPDADPNSGATLSYLKIENVGPAKILEFAPLTRMNIITGDNGLGKSFIMDCSWWALTGTWSGITIRPNQENMFKDKAQITYELAAKSGKPVRKSVNYNSKVQEWTRSKQSPTIPGLTIYAKVDGSYAVWDPIRNGLSETKEFVFNRDEVWNGRPRETEGLIRDWLTWQNSDNPYPFNLLESVLRKMSPPDMGILEPGKAVKIIDENTIRDMPTIRHPYGEVIITNTSAGVKRIVALAYLIVWAWYQHCLFAEKRNTAPESRMVIIIDEIEAHLHPKWQRTILPALLDVYSSLSKQLEIQFIISTHSPLVMASTESYFNGDLDCLFHLSASGDNYSATINELDFVKYGQVNSWLTSPVFNLGQARSQISEQLIEQATQLQLKKEPNKNIVQTLHNRLMLELPETDDFWIRWLYFAEKNGVEI